MATATSSSLSAASLLHPVPPRHRPLFFRALAASGSGSKKKPSKSKSSSKGKANALEARGRGARRCSRSSGRIPAATGSGPRRRRRGSGRPPRAPSSSPGSGSAASSSGFLPAEWDSFLVKFLYPSFTPTVLLFIGGTTGYGVFKCFEGEKSKS